MQVTAGPGFGRKTFLRAGQVVRVGRTEWADFNIPQDGTLAPVHFSLEYQANICRLRDLVGGGTLLNGQPVAESIVAHGDRITAGATTFSVHIEGNAAAAAPAPSPPFDKLTASGPSPPRGEGEPAAAPPTRQQSSGFVLVPTPLASTVCEQFELDDEAKPLLEPQMTVREFYQLLGKRQLFADAERLLSHALPKREAVWWSAQCIRATYGDQLPPADRAALTVAEEWAAEPTESNRRRAEGAAEQTKHETAAGWAAAAAFFSGGSIAPPDMPEVPPKETLTAQAVVVAITLSAAADPKKTPARHAEFVTLGARVGDGQVRWSDRK
ncbi:MAG TPA: FHA domain-containing protein [Pirellulales bacterium]